MNLSRVQEEILIMAEYVRDERRARQMGFRDLSEETGIRPSTLSRFEQGKIDPGSRASEEIEAIFAVLCARYNVPRDQIVEHRLPPLYKFPERCQHPKELLREVGNRIAEDESVARRIEGDHYVYEDVNWSYPVTIYVCLDCGKLIDGEFRTTIDPGEYDYKRGMAKRAEQLFTEYQASKA